MKPYEKLRELFRAPSREYRSLPFWGWNDELDKEELVRQAEQMKEQGMGGFFLHSRDGLETAYMGPEWMDCIRTTVDAAEALDMQVWLYDEDRWPSGFAGGLVQERGGDAFRAKGLTMEVVRPTGGEDWSEAVALFKAVIDEERGLYQCQRIMDYNAAAVSEGEVLLVFRVEVSVRSAWFNNEAPPDHLNPDTVSAFIDITYEAYKREVGDRFGTTIRGVFTDEPSIHDRHCKFTEGRGWLPWSTSFPDFFQSRRGYDLLDIVPYVFFNGEHSPQARHDYWWTVTERFSEAFSKQIGDWCEQNGIAFTGHYLWENNMGTATRVCGAVMPNYRFQQVPGIDLLNEQTNEYITVKQCSSVANQYGRKFVLSETYGCTGWGFTFEGQKWVGDFQYVLGVNLRSQHLALYSIKGCRKRDYPPVFNYNTSWWKYNHVVEDYFARLSAILSEGQPVRDVLVLHPSTTAWCRTGTGPYGFPARGKDRDVSATNHFGHEFNAFLGDLLRAHYDFDLGDEIIMAETGSVRQGKLAVNRTEYRVVIVPAILTMLASTFRLLSDFVAEGGRVIAVGPAPAMLEGRPSIELEELFKHPGVQMVQDTQEAVTALEAVLPRRVSLVNGRQEQARELLYMLREQDDCRTLFVVNNDREGTHRVQVAFEGQGRVEEWNSLTGEVTVIDAEVRDGRVHFEAVFAPADSKLYICKPEALNQAEPGKTGADLAAGQLQAQTAPLPYELGPVRGFTRTMPNVLTLDMCRYRIGSGEWSGEMEVWQAQRAIRDALGMRQVYGNGLEQRYRWIGDELPSNGTPAAFIFSFEVTDVPVNGAYLVVEGAAQYEIHCNGLPVANEPAGWFLDRAFHKVPLSGLQQGVNELVLSCAYHNRMEVEDIFIVGDFAVTPERKMISEPEQLMLGDWCGQGYTHYCGSLVYHFEAHLPKQDTGRVLLEIGDYAAVTMEVRVNGQTAGHLPWRAAGPLDITSWLQAGDNRIDIEVMGSPRNMLGPFHQTTGDTSTTSWASFRKEGIHYTPEYKLHPYGLLGSPKLYRFKQMEG
ncbi:glycosyl hydrolase [Paenibacillus sp. y28]|uniref:glycosyl hydrolase n=1 Tax=Paenibacillus sp. y28 TaxID=3129110 RepID=UPI003018F2E7